MFDALWLGTETGKFNAKVTRFCDEDLPKNEVILKVLMSSLNYKDALAILNRAPVVKKFPMIPGIDGAGVVLRSTHPEFSEGDEVILNGWGAGETYWGCLAQRAAVRGDWLIPMPKRLDSDAAMAIGTAGYTA